MAVKALLSVLNPNTKTDAISKTHTPTIAVDEISLAPSVTIFNIKADLTNKTVTYSYLIMQTYNNGLNMDVYSDTQTAVSTPNIADKDVAVTVSSATSAKQANGDIKYDIATVIKYDSIQQEIHTVVTADT